MNIWPVNSMNYAQIGATGTNQRVRVGRVVWIEMRGLNGRLQRIDDDGEEDRKDDNEGEKDLRDMPQLISLDF
jgi:hypothetical protein